MSNQINIWEDLTESGRENIKVGTLLRFKQGDTTIELRVMNKNMRKSKIMARPVKTFTPEDVGGSVRIVNK